MNPTILISLMITLVFGGGVMGTFMFIKKYPIRVIVLHKRAGREPLISYDRTGRIKDKDGVEHYKLFFTKDLIDVVESKYLYAGKGPINKTTLCLYEENKRYTPVELSFSDRIELKPINSVLEFKRLAAEKISRGIFSAA